MSVCRERATAHRSLRRQDKKLKDLLQSVEDERKQAEVYKAEVRSLGVGWLVVVVWE